MEQNKIDNRVLRAKIQTPVEAGDWDFECVAVPSENGQLKYSYINEEYYVEILKTGRNNIDTSRLENGLPLFDNHPWDNSAENTLGITTGFEFTERGLVCRCKFGSRADEALRADVKNGIINTVSIEGDINNYSITREFGKIPVYSADLWTPTSLSFAPVPNDIGAKIEVKRALEVQLKKDVKADDSALKTIINKF